LLTGERQGYYCDFGSLSALAKTLTHAFFHDGTFSTFRGRLHGVPIDTVTTPGYQFVVCLQNHDQVGNRAAGDRLAALVSPELLKVGATLLLTSPFTPMLWMGEEWAASTPWPFFTSHPEPELAKATAEGRIEEFAQHGWRREDVRDPQEESAFRDAKLRWSEAAEPGHAGMLDLYRTLIRLRRDNPGLSDPDLRRVSVSYDEVGQWIVVYRPGFAVVANLAEGTQTVPIKNAVSAVVFATAEGSHVAGSAVSMPARSAVVLTMAD
jgi:maltooligosyltrehalose trehalohydrolase